MSKIFSSKVPLALSVFVIVSTLELAVTVPVSIQSNGRTLRSVTLQRRSSNDENPLTNLLLSQQMKRSNTSSETIFAQRENSTGNGDGTSASSGDGCNDADNGGGEGGNGTFGNDTQLGSRLRQNETEPCSLEPPILCSSNSSHYNRDKQRRIAHIVNYLWTNLFGDRTRPNNKDVSRDRFPSTHPSSSSFSGRVQSIAASCDLPAEVESEAWSSRRYFSLFFNLTENYPEILGESQNSSNASVEQPSAESDLSHEYSPIVGSRPLLSSYTVTPKKSVNVVSAKLRLHKVGTSLNNVHTFATFEPSEPCNDTEATSSAEETVPSVFPTKISFPELSDEKIRVSVFWYTQPATKNHYKKKLVDAKMLSLRDFSWVEFDIKNAVKTWLNDRKPNFGLVVEVENENQDALDPRTYFHDVPCFKLSSEEGTSHRADSGNEPEGSTSPTRGNTNTSPQSQLSPMIEICTLNVPETLSTNYEQTKFFPYSMNINSLNHLQRVADSHAKSSNRSQSSTSRYPWQNVNLRVLSPEDFGIDAGAHERGSVSSSDETPRPTTTVIVPSHRHRHHHELNSQNNNSDQLGHTNGALDQQQSQQRNKSRFSHTNGFRLDEDHPLRNILATVNGNSRESSRPRGSASSGKHHLSESAAKGFGLNLTPEMVADDSRIGATDYLDSSENERDVFITKIIITPAQLRENTLHGLRRGFFPLVTPSSSPAPSNTGSLDR